MRVWFSRSAVGVYKVPQMTLMSSQAWETQCQTWFYRRGSQLVGRQRWNENSVPFFPASRSSLLSNSHSISECQHQMISGFIWKKKKKSLFWSHYQLCRVPLLCLYNSRNGKHIHKVDESLFPIPVTFHQFPMLIFKTVAVERVCWTPDGACIQAPGPKAAQITFLR